MKIGIPQIIMLFIYVCAFGIDLAKHGEKEERTYDAGKSLVVIIINIGLLWWGGFFS